MRFDLARDYMGLKAPLVEEGQFGVEIRGEVDTESKQEVIDLLTQASEYNASQTVGTCGIVLDFTSTGKHFYDGEILHLPLRAQRLATRRGGEVYFWSALVCILLILVLCVQHR